MNICRVSVYYFRCNLKVADPSVNLLPRSGIIPRIIELLLIHRVDFNLQLECAWLLTNVVSGKSEQVHSPMPTLCRGYIYIYIYMIHI
jgi:hypothetical protein